MDKIHSMALEIKSDGSTVNPQPQQSHHPAMHTSKAPQANPDSGRRHSLPLHFLPPNIWSANTSSASLAETGEAAHGEHILDEATVANRIAALRQLNGATRSRHQYAKSAGARNSTFSHPVIVRTYSGPTRPRSQQRDLIVKKENGYVSMTSHKKEVKLPPVEAFTFRGIMDEIRHGVSEDLERIAEICARSKYSLSNQYEVHMPPHGRGESILGGSGSSGSGPTLQAIVSDEEQTQQAGRGKGGGRRTKSAAYGTLETIMSSSRSSDEDKSRKKPAAVLAEEIRGRAVKKEQEGSKSQQNAPAVAGEPEASAPIVTRHVRSKSATFASIIIDNAQAFQREAATSLVSPISLISEPARPRTSTADLGNIPIIAEDFRLGPTSLPSVVPTKSYLPRNLSMSSTSKPPYLRPTILGSISSWLPWNKPIDLENLPGRSRRRSHAEGSLRELLKSTQHDGKGKSVDRGG